VPTCTLIAKKRKPAKKGKFNFKSGDNDPYSNKIKQTEVVQNSFLKNEHHIFNVIENSETNKIIKKITKNTLPLGDFLKVREGIKTGRDKDFLFDTPPEENSYPLVKGRDVKPFEINQKLFINYDRERLSRPQKKEQFLRDEKLLIRRVGANLIAGYDTEKLFCVHTLYTAYPEEDMPEGYSLKFFAALINSPLMDFYYKATSVKKGKVFPEVRIYSINSLPVKILNFKKKEDKRLHDEIADRTEKLVNLKKDKERNKTDQMKRLADRREQVLTDEINDKILELYKIEKAEVI
jgi:hypothetical protein